MKITPARKADGGKDEEKRLEQQTKNSDDGLSLVVTLTGYGRSVGTEALMEYWATVRLSMI